MSDTHDSETPRFDAFTGEPLEQPEPSNKDIKDLRAAAARANKSSQEADNLRRENAFLKAGIDTETPTGKMFFKAFDGDLSDLAALKSEAEAVGALRPATPPAPEPVADPNQRQNAPTQAEVIALAQRGQVASGAPPSQTVTGGQDPYIEARQGFEREVAEGRSTEDALANAFSKVLARYDEGDARTFYEQTPARDAGQDRVRG